MWHTVVFVDESSTSYRLVKSAHLVDDLVWFEEQKVSKRDGAVWSAYQSHDLKVGGSNPPPATK